ncbi:retropepsin-like aspartic protease [Nonomuraea candida]|uniref:retropepsin-like aspartic protease n=1 Tax=Nonomuraea candida TaxID=359159 RepID=UPI000A025A25|nr:retropepsin-like aspartic protease [Nonomuraea candida]
MTMPEQLPSSVPPSRRSVLAAAAALAVAGPLGAAIADPHAAHAERTAGADPDQLFRAGRFAAADAGYRRILARHPDHAHALAQRGYIALLSNRYADTERFLTRAIELAPGDNESKTRLADCYVRQNDPVRALPLLRAAGQKPKAAQYAAMQNVRPFQPSGEHNARVPFLHLDPLPVVEASCNGHRARYFFDTGATLIIGQETAESTGIEVLAETKLPQGGNQLTFYFGVARSFALGGLVLRNVPVMWNDGKAALPKVPGTDVQPTGVIGTTLLHHVLATLDYGRGEMVVRRPTPAQRRAFHTAARRKGATEVPFWMAPDHFLYVPGSVNGTGPKVCSIDTGGPGIGLVVTEPTAHDLGIELDYDNRGQFFGQTVYPFVHGARVSVGKIRRTVPGIAGPLNHSLERSKFDSLGNISHEFLRPLAFTFDFVSMRLSLLETA